MIGHELPDFYEELPQGTPILTGDEEPDITDTADLLLPTRAQLEERQAKEAQNDSQTEGSDGDAGAATDDSGDQDTRADTEIETPEDQVTQFAPEVADPGEFTPKDYSFEVQVFDENNANPKVVKIASPEDFDKLMADNANLGTPLALTKAMRQVTKMESNVERDKAAYETDRAKFDADKQLADQANAQVEATVKGLDYLVARGDLPKVATKYTNADWNDAEIAKQPGVKEQLEVIQFMATENKARVKAGLPEFASIVDAYSEFDRQQAKAALKTQNQQAVANRRQASMRVGATSPTAPSAVPKGIMVGRSLGSLDNI